MLYTRKLRRAHARERLENSRRGEEAGLPGYGESTMSPQTLSYLSSPLSYLRRPIATPSRTYHPNDVAAPPAYLSPPKYETEGEQIAMVPSDREAEVGGTGIQETDITDSPIIVTPALNSNAVVNPSPVDNPWSSDVERR